LHAAVSRRENRMLREGQQQVLQECENLVLPYTEIFISDGVPCVRLSDQKDVQFFRQMGKGCVKGGKGPAGT
jgi:hypothetical protein